MGVYLAPIPSRRRMLWERVRARWLRLRYRRTGGLPPVWQDVGIMHEESGQFSRMQREVIDAFDVPRGLILDDPTPADLAHDEANRARWEAEREQPPTPE